MRRRHAPVAALLVALAGCGGSVSVDTGGSVAVGHRTMAHPAIPFTFEYPVDFRQATARSLRQANALVAVGPEANSYIAVRRNGPAMSISGLERQALRALGDSVVATARERHGGVDMVVVDVADTDPQRLGLRSTIYGFSAGDSSWLIECHATRRDRARLTRGCRQAIDSLRMAA